MRKLAPFGMAILAALLGAGSPKARHAAADPSEIWAVNQVIANTMQGATVDFSTPAGRAVVAAKLDWFQDVSAGLIGLTSDVNISSGQPLILVQTNGSATSVVLEGRGLHCAPACDSVTPASPDPVDHFLVYTVLDAGSHVEGDVVFVSAVQDSVELTGIPLRVIGSGADIDGDGCPDVKEPALVPPANYLNAWDFYSVPVPALFAAPNPLLAIRDGIVGASDAQAVFGYLKKSAKAGSLEYEQDLNSNGIPDGVEYDRSFVGPGQSGPPNGVISASDAQLAFAQFKLGYKC